MTLQAEHPDSFLRSAHSLAGQSINVHVYPSKPEGVFVPEGAVAEMPGLSDSCRSTDALEMAGCVADSAESSEILVDP